MKRFIFSIAMILCASAAIAQMSCYGPRRNKGMEAYKKGNYKGAKEYFMLALQCAESPANVKTELNNWIRKCDNRITVIAANAASDKGSVINGVCWATSNVASPGEFAEKPEDPGMFYQWNRRKAWITTGDRVPNWNGSTPDGNKWVRANDPCPAGWRVPTYEEFVELLDDEKVKCEWITINKVEGRRFTDKTSGNSIFLPAAGYRNYGDGSLWKSDSFYWSSTPNGSGDACYLGVISDMVGSGSGTRIKACSVRCVAEGQ